MKRPGEVFTPAEIDALLSAFPETRVGVRDRALTAVTLYAGLRCSEALSLRPCDVDLDRMSVTIMNGKGSKRGVSGMNPKAVPYLEAWLAARGDSEWLFHTRTGKGMLACYFREMIKKAGARAGIRHRCHPHALRHSCAVSLAKANVPVPIISKQLRHSNIATTAAYLDHFSAAEVVDQVSAVSW
jgi:integrase